MTREFNEKIRLYDRMRPVVEAMEDLERQRVALRAQLADIGATADATENEIAEVYWHLESVPATLLGRQRDILEAAQRYPWWSWTCEQCGAEVFITSRTDKRAREPGAKWARSPFCAQCKAARRAATDAGWEAAAALRRERERLLATMPYRAYLRTEERQARRLAALKRAGHRRQVCNRSRTLHVHHRTYERCGVELARDLIVLCDQCHALYHGKGLLPAHATPEDALHD